MGGPLLHNRVMTQEKSNHSNTASGLWLISQAVGELELQNEVSNVNKHEEAKNHTTQINEEIQTVLVKKKNFKNLERGCLNNDDESLCAFFDEFGQVCKRPLKYHMDSTDSKGNITCIRKAKALPFTFLRLAAALVVHHK